MHGQVRVIPLAPATAAINCFRLGGAANDAEVETHRHATEVDVHHLRRAGPLRDGVRRRDRSVRSVTRVIAAVAGAAALTVLPASGAFAHECFIANRSDKGNAGAANSKAWETVTIETIVNDFIGLPPPLSTCVLAKWEAADLPAQFTFRADKTIGEGSSNPNLANGKGLEHAEDVYGPTIEKFIGECSAP